MVTYTCIGVSVHQDMHPPAPTQANIKDANGNNIGTISAKTNDRNQSPTNPGLGMESTVFLYGDSEIIGPYNLPAANVECCDLGNAA